MSKVRILLQGGESIEAAKEELFKALEAQRTPKESFSDPAMIDASQQAIAIYDEEYALMLEEINTALDAEYGENWGI